MVTLTNYIEYEEGYKYWLKTDFAYVSDILVDENIITDFYSILVGGLILVKHGYAWDGSSGPAKDTKNSQRASLVHDVLCQAVQAGHLEVKWKWQADKEYFKLCRLDGMWLWRAGLRWIALKNHDWENTKPKEIQRAP